MKAFVASSYLWTPVVFPFWLAGHAVGVKRGKRDKKAMKLALKALREGFVFAVSPQGTRSRNGKLGEAKFGPAYLAGTTNVPVVPVAIIGSKGGLKDVLMLRRPKVQIVFGKPFHLDMDWTKLINGAGDPAVKAYCAEVVEQQIMPKIRQLHAVHGSVK